MPSIKNGKETLAEEVHKKEKKMKKEKVVEKVVEEKKEKKEKKKKEKEEKKEEKEEERKEEKKEKKKGKKEEKEEKKEEKEEKKEEKEEKKGTKRSLEGADEEGSKKKPKKEERQKDQSTKAVRKNFYQEHPEQKKYTQAEIDAYRAENFIALHPPEAAALYKPILKFNHASIPADVLKYTARFQTPSPIQSQCWPVVLSGKDVVGIASTGSGKTVAFGLPALVHICDQKPFPKNSLPIVLVLAPTRELAIQIHEVFAEAGANCGVRSVCVYGGVPKEDQRKELRKGVQVVIATPGRLADLLEEKSCSLDNITYVVLDEADRMLDMGFEKDVRALLSKIPNKDRQTLMFSATWPKAIQELSRDFLVDPVRVIIGSEDLSANHNVTQIIEVIEQPRKETRLDELLRKYHASRTNKVLVFALYKKEADRLEQFLTRKGWKVASIHGDKSQNERSQALENFKKGTHPLLIATDVAARGLDIPNVEYVVNVTFPLTIEDYVHRIGRTGRAGKKGIAHTLFTSFDKAHAGALVNVLKEAKQEVPENLLKFGTHTKKKEHNLYGAHFKDVDDAPKAQKITFDDD